MKSDKEFPDSQASDLDHTIAQKMASDDALFFHPLEMESLITIPRRRRKRRGRPKKKTG